MTADCAALHSTVRRPPFIYSRRGIGPDAASVTVRRLVALLVLRGVEGSIIPYTVRAVIEPIAKASFKKKGGEDKNFGLEQHGYGGCGV
ncbi:unnamed protein product [Fusarium venenatum]|uniref:Uncharacterized protein n=1 Tax=Fusarium venenatum TaxID=56646 RepID=A0A2L2TCS3_9HYPO|nr:uncharacterized protein FVRRES_07955 [Fusarium venenatum]CEI67878.1 unnamed protein product [Fusarium venenatum]